MTLQNVYIVTLELLICYISWHGEIKIVDGIKVAN